MKILLVVHYFLPRHQAGTEIYTAQLARRFTELGHQVTMLASEDSGREALRLSWVRDDWEGIPVYRLFHGEPLEFARSYTDPEIDRLFRDFLQEQKPDVVHFQHVFRLSAGMIPVCEAAGIPALITLADFWLICPPLLLLQPGFSICPGPEPERCARCGNAIGALYAGAPGHGLVRSENALTRAAGNLIHAASEKAVQTAHALKRRLPREAVDRIRQWKQGREAADPESSFQRRLALIVARQKAMKEALAAARLVIAPSEFLRRMTIQAGAVAPEKIIHSDYGFETGPFQGLARSAADHLRFGFIGTPVEHKGLHVAIAAMNRLQDTTAELLVHGDLNLFPAYARRLKKTALNPRIRFMGRFEHREIAAILSDIDALIAPSLWFENSPLTIHEAFLARVPVVASDLGGMAELVGPGGGRLFPAGNDDALARLLRELIEEPAKLDQLRKTIPPVKSLDENVEELLGIYRRFV